MSAVLDSIANPVAEARAALDVARRELAALDERIRAYEGEAEEIEMQRHQHRVKTINAVGANQPLPKALKLKASDADVAVPILRGNRKALAERVAECEGALRRAAVNEIERRYALALDAFAGSSAALIANWRELVGVRQLLDQAGMGAHVAPLPPSLTGDFFIPAMGRLRPIIANHWAHFVASHALAQGELFRATDATRAAVERDIGMRLPW